MNCPFCGYFDSKVVDSRDINDSVRRRRECLQCNARFTTYERWQVASLFVIKKDNRREEFKVEKVLAGVRKACEKRPLASGAVEKLVDDIEGELYRMGKTEIPTTVIGDMVMARLKVLDHIAYIRFASIYRDFADITMLKEEVDSIAGRADLPNINQLPLIPREELVEMVNNSKRGRK